MIQMISMHGCSETDEGTRPYLHTMGPSDQAGTIQHGLQKGHIFGFIGSTDHHSAHPGSYGHGLTGLWAEARTRHAIWDALLQRRTYALTGDKIQLEFSLNDHPMGAVIPHCRSRKIDIHIIGGGAIDYVDVVKNNKLLSRFSESYVSNLDAKETLETKLVLELGWGPVISGRTGKHYLASPQAVFWRLNLASGETKSSRRSIIIQPPGKTFIDLNGNKSMTRMSKSKQSHSEIPTT